MSTRRTTVILLLALLSIISIAIMLSLNVGAIHDPVRAQTTEAYTWRNVAINGGGFVPGFVFNTSEPNLVYARTDIGGAYRWNQATESWIPLLDWIGFDDWNLTGVDSIATDPRDPNRVYIAAGTYTNEWTGMNGAILRSTDRGNTWQRTDLPFKVGGNMPGRSMGERLAIDPNRNSILYLGARSGNGLWRSTDFGATWSKVANFPNAGTYVEDPSSSYTGDIVGVVWVTFDPSTGTPGSTTKTIYVGVADQGTSIYRSTDGGATWAAVPGQPTGYLPHHGVLSSTGMLYLSYSDGAGPYDGEKGDVWKFDTTNGTWTMISPVPSSSSDDYFGYGGLSVDAQHPNTIMVAALNSWWPDTIFFRSTDGGASWTRIWDYTAYPNRSFRYLQDISAAPWLTFGTNPQLPEITPKLGWMVGDLEIDPFNSDRMFYGTGATIYGTDNLTDWDRGGTINISVKVQGLEETAVLDLISPPSGAPLLSGLGDICGFRHDDLAAVPPLMMTSPTFTSTTSLDYAELMPNFIVRAGNADAGINNSGFSFDGGASWFAGNTQPGGITGGGTIAAAANGGRVVWSPAGAAVYFSTDNGSSWTPAAGIPQGALVRSDRVNPMKFYGFANGSFYLSIDGGASFTAAATGLPASAQFKAAPGHEGDIWLAGGEGGLWRSTDSGVSFTRISSVEEADTIGFGKAAPGENYPALYSSAQVNGIRGIYRSDDTGASWVRINDDRHQYGMTSAAITGDPRVYGRVYVATNGRGIIYGEPNAAPNPDFSVTPNPASLAVNRGESGTSTLTVSRSGGFSGSVAFSASGLPSGVTATFSPAATTGASATLTLSASSSAISGPATITVTATGGDLTRAATVSLTVNAPQPQPDFAISAGSPSGTINRGASGTGEITITRSGGFTGAIALSASGLPSGVTARFNPATTTGATSTVTFTAASTAALGPASVTISGTGGGLTRTTSLDLTVSESTGGTGGVTITPVVSVSGPWFNEEVLRLSNPAAITSLSLTIVIQRAGNIGFNGQYNTIGREILQNNSSTGTEITYQFNLAAGQMLGPGSNRTFAAQSSGTGTVHPTSGDTYTVTYTTAGVSYTQSGHF